jgi:hypothetical protein
LESKTFSSLVEYISVTRRLLQVGDSLEFN